MRKYGLTVGVCINKTVPSLAGVKRFVLWRVWKLRDVLDAEGLVREHTETPPNMFRCTSLCERLVWCSHAECVHITRYTHQIKDEESTAKE